MTPTCRGYRESLQAVLSAWRRAGRLQRLAARRPCSALGGAQAGSFGASRRCSSGRLGALVVAAAGQVVDAAGELRLHRMRRRARPVGVGVRASQLSGRSPATDGAGWAGTGTAPCPRRCRRGPERGPGAATPATPRTRAREDPRSRESLRSLRIARILSCLGRAAEGRRSEIDASTRLWHDCKYLCTRRRRPTSRSLPRCWASSLHKREPT